MEVYDSVLVHFITGLQHFRRTPGHQIPRSVELSQVLSLNGETFASGPYFKTLL